MTPSDLRRQAAECRARAATADTSDGRRHDLEQATQLEARASQMEAELAGNHVTDQDDEEAGWIEFAVTCQRVREQEEAGRSTRIRKALGQMEAICPPTTN